MIDLFRKMLCVFASMIAFTADHPLIAGHLSSQDQKDEQVKLSASLVQVPATVTDRSGKFVSDLTKSDFSLAEDGKKQDISFFAAVKQPFSAVLVLDTSNSTQDRLRVIQNAAVDFTKQL